MERLIYAGKRNVVVRILARILIAGIVVIQAAGCLLCALSSILFKGIAVLMVAAAGILYFLSDFSGGNTLFVIITATVLFWIPEILFLLLAALAALQVKIADMFL